MALLYQRYLKRLLALIMAVGIMAPTLIKLGHTFHGHWDEQQCVSQGTDHIHKGTLDCDFNDHTLASKILFTSQFLYVPVEVHEPHYRISYLSLVVESFERRDLAPRAPPQFAPSWT